MDKKELGNRVKLARKQFSKQTNKNLTQHLLAERIGISRSYLGDIESGRTYPTFIVLNAIAQVCNVPLSFFEADIEVTYDCNLALDNSNLQPFHDFSKYDKRTVNAVLSHISSSNSIGNNLIAVPVLGTIRAGVSMLAEQNIIGYEYIPRQFASTGEYFGLKVVGDSMNNSRIFEGDILLVRRQEEVENGEIAVVLIGSEEATVKRFFKTNSIVTLMPDSTNKEHHPQVIQTSDVSIKILGKVIKVIINL